MLSPNHMGSGQNAMHHMHADCSKDWSNEHWDSETDGSCMFSYRSLCRAYGAIQSLPETVVCGVMDLRSRWCFTAN